MTNTCQKLAKPMSNGIWKGNGIVQARPIWYSI
jgi:hypothetical protein